MQPEAGSKPEACERFYAELEKCRRVFWFLSERRKQGFSLKFSVFFSYLYVRTMRKHHTYGYIRVSTREQNELRQLDALRAAGLSSSYIFCDKQSGKDFVRPSYQRLLRRLRAGDLIYVTSIDRLGRNYAEVLEQWRVITKEVGADICVLDMPLLDTRKGKDLMGTFIADLVLQILSFVAQSERENIRKRQAEGILAAKMQGVRFGRPARELPENFPEVFAEWKAGRISGSKAAACCGMPVSTFRYRARRFAGDAVGGAGDEGGD